MKKFVIIFSAILLLSSCSTKQRELKSPCVGLEGSPCAKRPVNNWLHEKA